MSKWQKIAFTTDILLAGLLSVVIIFTPLNFLVNTLDIFYGQWFEADDYKGDFYQINEILSTQRQVSEFLKTGNTASLNKFDSQSLAHLVEVKGIISVTRTLAVWGMVFLIVAAIWLVLFRKKISRVTRILRFSSNYIFLFLITFWLTTSINFQYFFTVFHEALFSNTWWLYSNDALIINIYTESFFEDFLLSWLTLVTFCSIVILLLSKLLKKYVNR